MIQELIYTSVPKGLAPDSQGFCTVAQTAGMTPLVSQTLKNLSGYRHTFPIGDERKPLNPEVFIHVIRRIAGADLHIVSRVADCGVDYTQRSNLIAHHYTFEESDCIPCGPAAILSQPNLFRKNWNEKPREITSAPDIHNIQFPSNKCVTWEKQLGDAGWGGVVAERIEQGDPIIFIFDPKIKMLPLLVETFAILPPQLRWETTFSTFFIKSQEPPNTNKIQIKCILNGSDEETFAKLTNNNFVLDLRQKQNLSPTGKYVEFARTGFVAKASIPPKIIIGNKTNEIKMPNTTPIIVPMQKRQIPIKNTRVYDSQQTNQLSVSFWIKLFIVTIIITLVITGLLALAKYS
ncbi:MAG: hypothetical protein LBB88_10595 [Planctomycetaceae bacterium]|jgi:hypothetical protein|nr:hypothetical protein [Planctomycetaceae bacterium]